MSNYNNVNKIRLTFPYDWPILRQTPRCSGEWMDFQFYVNPLEDEEFDFWVVYEDLIKPFEKGNVAKNNTLFFAAEPPSVRKYSKRFINQFGSVVTCNDDMSHNRKILFPQAQPWFVNKSFDELNNLEDVKKTEKISLIVSNKTITSGHRQRLDFAKKIKQYFGKEVSLFGRGIVDFDDKWDVLAPFQYNICLENTFYRNYFTEKIVDCYLSYTFPIYYGCPNLEDFFDKDSFMRIDINNLELSIKTIKQILISGNHYKSQIENLKISRNRCLMEYNLFPLITNLIKKKNLITPPNPSSKIYLRKGMRSIVANYSKMALENLFFRSNS